MQFIHRTYQRLPHRYRRHLRKLLRSNHIRKVAIRFGTRSMGGDPIAEILRANSPVHLVVHVGAHLAEEVLHYESLGATTVLWIEADPDLFRRLEVRLGGLPASQTSHRAVRALVSSKSGGTLYLNHFSNDGASNSVYRSAYNLQSLWPGLKETGSQVELSTRTLAEILDEEAVSVESFPSSLLVLDVQGHELDVLVGAGKDLVGLFTFVCCEVSLEAIYEGAPSGWSVLEWLQLAGFEPVTAIPSIHGDVLLKRRLEPVQTND